MHAIILLYKHTVNISISLSLLHHFLSLQLSDYPAVVRWASGHDKLNFSLTLRHIRHSETWPQLSVVTFTSFNTSHKSTFNSLTVGFIFPCLHFIFPSFFTMTILLRISSIVHWGETDLEGLNSLWHWDIVVCYWVRIPNFIVQ